MRLYIWPFTFSLSLLKEMSSNWLRNTADISSFLTQKSECKTLKAVVLMIHNMNCIYDLFWGSLTWKEAFLETIKLFWNDEMVYFWIIQFIFLRLWIDLGAIELIDQVQPSFAFQAAFWSLSQFTVHGLKFQKVTEMIIGWLSRLYER